MQKENLIKMAEHILTIPQKLFDMEKFYKYNYDPTNILNCNTVGCVIGHCVSLDPNITRYMHEGSDTSIKYVDWSEDFTGIDYFSKEWDYMFSGEWSKIDNTIQGAHDRIMAVVNGLKVTLKDLPWQIGLSGKMLAC